jgi:hypothetical protein
MMSVKTHANAIGSTHWDVEVTFQSPSNKRYNRIDAIDAAEVLFNDQLRRDVEFVALAYGWKNPQWDLYDYTRQIKKIRRFSRNGGWEVTLIGALRISGINPE